MQDIDPKSSKATSVAGPLRVAHIITRLIVGGAQENTIDTVLGLRKKWGVDAQLITGPTSGPEGSLVSRFASQPHLLHCAPDLVRQINPWRDVRAYFQVIDCLKKIKPRIVHTHSGKAGIIGRLAARRLKVPIIIHGIHGPSFGPFQGKVSNFVFRNVEKLVSGYTTHFATVARAMEHQYLAAGIGQPGQFTRILSGFSLEPFLNTTRDTVRIAGLGWPADSIVFGCVARLFEHKGHDDILDVAPEIIRRHNLARFLFVGDGEWRNRLQTRVIQSNLQNHVHFTGLVTPDEVPSWIGCMDSLIHLSTREGLPRALSQGAAAGKPLLAYECDGAPEICLNNVNGFLIPRGDKGLLLDYMERFIQDGNLRVNFGLAGRQFVRKHFSVETMVDETWALYQRLENLIRPISNTYAR